MRRHLPLRLHWLTRLLPMLAMVALAGLCQPAAAADIGIGADVGPVETLDEAQATQPRWRYRVGLGIGLTPDYVGSDDYRVAPLPQVSASKGPQYVNLTGTYLFSNLLPSANWRLGPTAKFIRGDRCNSSDNRVSEQKCQADALMLRATGGYASASSACSTTTSLSAGGSRFSAGTPG